MWAYAQEGISRTNGQEIIEGRETASVTLLPPGWKVPYDVILKYENITFNLSDQYLFNTETTAYTGYVTSWDLSSYLFSSRIHFLCTT